MHVGNRGVWTGVHMAPESSWIAVVSEREGAVAVRRIASFPTPDEGIRQGRVLEPGAAGRALRRQLHSLGSDRSHVVAGLPGPSTYHRLLRIPALRGRPLQEALRWELKRHLPQLDAMELDFIEFPADPDEPFPPATVEVLVTAAARGEIAALRRALERARLGLRALDSQAFALHRTAAYLDGFAPDHRAPEALYGIVALGRHFGSLTLVRGGRPAYHKAFTRIPAEEPPLEAVVEVAEGLVGRPEFPQLDELILLAGEVDRKWLGSLQHLVAERWTQRAKAAPPRVRLPHALDRISPWEAEMGGEAAIALGLALWGCQGVWAAPADRINLLRPRYRLPRIERRQRLLDRSLIATVAGLAILYGALRWGELTRTQATLATVEGPLDRLQSDLALADEVQALERQLDRFQAALAEGDDTLHPAEIRALLNAAPPGVEMAAIEVAPSGVLLRGAAARLSDAAAYLHRLESLPRWTGWTISLATAAAGPGEPGAFPFEIAGARREEVAR